MDVPRHSAPPARGRGVTQNDARAVKHLQAAADQGDAGARCALGNMYADGHGVAKNEAPAVKLWPAAADQGDARAQCNLGVMYTGAASPRTRRSR